MKLEKMKVTEEKEAELPKEQFDNLFYQLVRGQDATEEIETSRGLFKVKYPRVRDLENISRLTVVKTNGLPSGSFLPVSYGLILQTSTLDVVVVSGPSWFENAKKEVKNFSWSDIPDQKFVEEVYVKSYTFRTSVQGQFEQKQDSTDSGMASGTGDSVPADSGAFEGMSGSAGTAR